MPLKACSEQSKSCVVIVLLTIFDFPIRRGCAQGDQPTFEIPLCANSTKLCLWKILLEMERTTDNQLSKETLMSGTNNEWSAMQCLKQWRGPIFVWILLKDFSIHCPESFLQPVHASEMHRESSSSIFGQRLATPNQWQQFLSSVQTFCGTPLS